MASPEVCFADKLCLGRCTPGRISTCALLAASYTQGVFDCAGLLRYHDRGDTLSTSAAVDGRQVCRVFRCGRPGSEPEALLAAGESVVRSSPMDAAPGGWETYSYACATPPAASSLAAVSQEGSEWTWLQGNLDGTVGRVQLGGDVDKREDYWTTSARFKSDVRRVFEGVGSNWTVLELGTYRGYTTRVLSEVFRRVFAIEASDSFLATNQMVNFDRDNIMFVRLHSHMDGLSSLRYNDVKVVLIDAEHEYESAKRDVLEVLRTFSRSVRFLIFDDYGTDEGVARAVGELVAAGMLRVLGGIGQAPPWSYRGKVVHTWEGVVCEVVDPAMAASPSAALVGEGQLLEGASEPFLDRKYSWLQETLLCTRDWVMFRAGGVADTTRGPGRWWASQGERMLIWLEWPNGPEGKLVLWACQFDEHWDRFTSATSDGSATSAGVSKEVFESMFRRIFVSVQHEWCHTANTCHDSRAA